MNDIIANSHPFEQVDDNPQHIKYDFVSLGEQEIPKRVSFMRYREKGLENYFNLGLGNLSINENGEEEISDMSRTNNKNDADRVLKTVLTCTLDFLSNFPDAIVTFHGNTYAKHRLYKMGLNKYIQSIVKFLEVKGGIILELEIVETEDGGKTAAPVIHFDNINYELYNCDNSLNYNFITFELQEKIKSVL